MGPQEDWVWWCKNTRMQMWCSDSNNTCVHLEARGMETPANASFSFRSFKFQSWSISNPGGNESGRNTYIFLLPQILNINSSRVLVSQKRMIVRFWPPLNKNSQDTNKSTLIYRLIQTFLCSVGLTYAWQKPHKVRKSCCLRKNFSSAFLLILAWEKGDTTVSCGLNKKHLSQSS